MIIVLVRTNLCSDHHCNNKKWTKGHDTAFDSWRQETESVEWRTEVIKGDSSFQVSDALLACPNVNFRLVCFSLRSRSFSHKLLTLLKGIPDSIRNPRYTYAIAFVVPCRTTRLLIKLSDVTLRRIITNKLYDRAAELEKGETPKINFNSLWHWRLSVQAKIIRIPRYQDIGF